MFYAIFFLVPLAIKLFGMTNFVYSDSVILLCEVTKGNKQRLN